MLEGPGGTPRLYAIADCDILGAGRLPAAVETMAECGIEWIQVRAKHASGSELYGLVERCLRRLEGSATALWIDDRADIAALFPVAGVHVGQDDLPPRAVREVVGDDCRIGRSTHDAAQAEAAQADQEVDVVALGPIFATSSKERPDPVVGLAGLRRVRRRVSKPLVAIGGIAAANLASVLAAGADAAVVLGAVCHGEVGRNCRRLQQATREVE